MRVVHDAHVNDGLDGVLAEHLFDLLLAQVDLHVLDVFGATNEGPAVDPDDALVAVQQLGQHAT